MNAHHGLPLTLAAVEKLTGLSREVLRKWTNRYQFPKPLRGRRGERLFSPDDVRRLRLQARLVAAGHRAGQVVPLDTGQLQALIDANAPDAACTLTPAQLDAHVCALMQLLASASFADALELWLDGLIHQLGSAAFAAQVMPVFNQAVGDAWQVGDLSVHAEHLYTETLRQTLLRTLPPLAPALAERAPACVLLTTPPQELHSMGLLALQIQLRLAGATAVSLGTQTPVAEVLAAAQAHAAQVVAISISGHLAPDEGSRYLQALRSGLAPACALWVGGAGCAALSTEAAHGCEVFRDTASAVLRWRTLVTGGH